jgi:protease I
MEKNLMDKKIAVIIPQKNFWDEEVEGVTEELDPQGAEIYFVARSFEPCLGLRRTPIKPDMTYEEFDPGQFDGIILIGGPGAKQFLWKDETLIQLLSSLKNVQKPILAFTTAPVALALSGLLENKKATVFSDFNAVSLFEDHKVIYDKEKIVKDGTIITTNERDVTKEAVQLFIEIL